MKNSFISNNKDVLLMRKAIQLALLGGGHVHPNPLVGAVIARNGEFLAGGYHHEYGGLHAERDALKNAADSNTDVKGADMYVTLEPCCHTGKQPPCTQAIIASGIKRVIVGSRDPNPLVSGKGFLELQKAGIIVERDFLRDECDSINKIFFHYITKKTPYVIVKYAVSADGRTCADSGDSKWITGPCAREYVHRMRSGVAAVMTGSATVAADNPLLTCRLEPSEKFIPHNPVRIVCDTNLSVSPDCALMKTAREVPVIIACSKHSFSKNQDKAAVLKDLGAKILCVQEYGGHLSMPSLLCELGKEGIDSILVESGGTLSGSLFFSPRGCLVNEVCCFIGSKILGGHLAHGPVGGDGCSKVSESISLSKPSVRVFGSDILLSYSVTGNGEEQCSQE